MNNTEVIAVSSLTNSTKPKEWYGYVLVGSINSLRHKRIVVSEIENVLFTEDSKPISEAIEVLRGFPRSDYAIVLVTDKRDDAVKDTMQLLSDNDVPFDLVVFRGKRKNVQGAKNVVMTISSLGIMNSVGFLHTSSKHLAGEMVDSVKEGVYYWYKPGKYVLLPPVAAWINDYSRVELPVTIHKISSAIGRTELRENGPFTVEWMGYRYSCRDMFDVTVALYYIGSVVSDILHYPKFIVAVDPDDIERNTGKLVVRSREYPIISEGIDRVELDPYLGDSERFWRNAYSYMVEKGADIMANEKFPYNKHPVLGDIVLDMKNMYREIITSIASIRMNGEPYDKPVEHLPEPVRLDVLRTEPFRKVLRDAIRYSAYNLGYKLELELVASDNWTKGLILTVKMGTAWIGMAMKVHSYSASANMVEYREKLRKNIESMKKYLKILAESHGIKHSNAYAGFVDNYILVYLRIHP